MKKVITYGLYPTRWDDLLLEDGTFLATIYTLEEARQDEHVDFNEPRIYEKEDGWDIVVDALQLTPEKVQASLDDLSEKTGEEYRFDPCYDDLNDA